MTAETTSTRPALLVFADDWGRHPSSCQHLIRRLIHDYDVLWVNSIGTRRLRLDLFTLRRGIEKLLNWKKGLQSTEQRMWVVDLPMLPFAGRLWRTINRKLVARRLRRELRKLNLSNPIVITTLPNIAPLVADVPRRALIYYCTDDYSHWPDADRAAMQQAEQDTLQQADLVLAVSATLVKRFSGHRDCRYFPHGVEVKHFGCVQNAEAAAEVASLPAPRIGFFGLIYEKLNFQLLAEIAKAFSGGSVILIGPQAYCPDWFRQLPNVHLVGPKPYADLPQWIAALDVLLLPYADDPMIRQSNPLKLRECLATGKPTVSIDIPEVRQYMPELRVGATTEEFICAIRHSIDRPCTPTDVELRQNRVRNEDWDSRASQLKVWLRELALAPTAPS